MEVSLKTFVAETIREIFEGIAEAQTSIIDGAKKVDEGSLTIGGGGWKKIEFDISVTSSETNDSSGKAGLMIKVLDFGVKSANTNQLSAVNRIKFEVPIIFPEKGTYQSKYPMR
jgi:hypothetical protein